MLIFPVIYDSHVKSSRIIKNFKDIFTQRKKSIQQKIYEEFGLRVDEPRPVGANSTTGLLVLGLVI